MQETKKRISPDDGWIRCPECKHKLFKMIQKGQNQDKIIEIKCHACKKISEINL